jgi:hypothetical protein
MTWIEPASQGRFEFFDCWRGDVVAFPFSSSGIIRSFVHLLLSIHSTHFPSCLYLLFLP